MKSIVKIWFTGIIIFLFIGLSNAQEPCVPTDLNSNDVTARTAILSWAGISGPSHVRYYVEGTNLYRYKFVDGTTVTLFQLLPETNYIWDVNNFCNGVWTTYTGNATFTTLADSTIICVPSNLQSAEITAHTAVLSWEGISGPTHVRYYVEGTNLYRYKFIDGTTVTLTQLLPETNYVWDVNNFCNGVWTSYTGNAAFTTLADSTIVCLPSNLQSSEITAHTAVLSWEGISGPTHVRYYVEGTNLYRYKFIDGTTVTLTQLLPETNYVWDLNNFCNGVWTPYTGNATFTTLADSTIICVPSNLQSAEITAHTAVLSWEGISGPTHVRYYVEGTNLYRYKFVDGTTVTLTQLLSETNYVWDVNNFCNGIWTPYTGNATFTTLADSTINCVPSNLQSSDITAHTAVLSWEGISGPTRVRYFAEGSTQYKYKFTSGTSVLLKVLASETTYFWDLSNFCNGIWTPYSGNASFTTLADTVYVCEPEILSATSISATTATLSWENFVGPSHIKYSPVGSADYKVACTFTNSVVLTNLLPATDYEWQLSVKCGFQWLPYGESNYFSTLSDSIPGEVKILQLGKTSLIGSSEKDQFNVFPNPVSGTSKFSFNTDNQEKYSVSIVDLTGKEIYNILGITEIGLNELSVDLSQAKSGVYFLLYRAESTNQTIKLVRE